MLACLSDWALVGDPERLELERELPSRAGLGQPLLRRLRIQAPRTQAKRQFSGELREEYPAHCETSQHVPESFALPGSDASQPVELERLYTSDVRGRITFGDLRVRLFGPLGLMIRQGHFAGQQSVAIEPALLGLSRRLELAASERWRDLGARTLRRKGRATEFESLREYVQGDDVRSVDWKAFAKRGTPLVREFQEERGQELLIALDCGRAMTLLGALGPRRGWTKLDAGLDAALQLAAVALRCGDRVGALAFDLRPRAWVAPRRGVRQQKRLREALFDLQPARRATDLERALRELAVRHPKRATIVLISDVADPLSITEQGRALRTASRRHQLIFVALEDPDLAALVEQQPNSELGRAAQELIDERQDSLRQLKKSAAQNTRVISAPGDESAGPLIAAWLDTRRGARRAARCGTRH